MLSKCDDVDDPICVAKAPIRIRMCYLRKVYFILSIQQFILAIVSFTLFMTPGVRPFVQHYTSTTYSTALALVVSFFCLRHAANHAPRLTGLSFFLFTLVLALTCAVATTYFDTEMVYTVCSMNGCIFLAHSIYCIQTLHSLHFVPSAAFTVFLLPFLAWFLELFFEFASFDYLSHILLSSAICIYVHWSVGYFSQILTSAVERVFHLSLERDTELLYKVVL